MDDILVDVDGASQPNSASNSPRKAAEYTEIPSSSNATTSAASSSVVNPFAGAASAAAAATIDAEVIVLDGKSGGGAASNTSYQNQTAADIESGRARVDSVGSYGSGGSDEALLPHHSSTTAPAASTAAAAASAGVLTSPRRTNRADRPLLSRNNYEEIEEPANTFPGEFFSIYCINYRVRKDEINNTL